MKSLLASFHSTRIADHPLIQPALRFTSTYGLVVFGAGFSRLLTLFASILIARTLTVEDFGIYTTAYTLIMLVGQLPGVLDSSYVRHYAGTATVEQKRSLTRAHLYIKLGSAFAILVVAVAFSSLLSESLFGAQGYQALILSAMFGGASFSLFTTWLAYYQGRAQYLPYAGLNLLQAVVGFIAIVIYLAVTQPTVAGAVTTYNFTLATLALVALALLLTNSSASGFMQIRTHAATLLKFSGWLIPASVAYIFLQRVDVLLLTRYSDHYQLGLYSSAIRIIGVVSIFTGNLMVIFLPKAAAAVRSRRALNNYLVQSLIAISGILLVILLAIVFAPQMLTLTMGENYLPAAGALRLLLVSYIFIAILSPTSALLYGLDQTVLIFIERCVEIIVAVVAALLLVPAHGMIGAASALVLAYFCGCVFILVCDFTLVKPQEQES